MTKVELLEYCENLEDAIAAALAALRENDLDGAIANLEEYEEERGEPEEEE